MKQNRVRLCAFAVCVLLLAAMFVPYAMAAGSVDVDADSTLNILYKKDEAPISGAEFSIYRIADVKATGELCVTDEFSKYPVEFDGIDQDGWKTLAQTLKGLVQQDGLAPYIKGTTDDSGNIALTVKCGVYLVFGAPTKLNEADTCIFDPFIVVLPVLDEASNTWVYSVTAQPKNTNCITARKVIKVWNDDGYETIRPESISVDLLCDGKVVKTVELNKENNWSYEFGDLEAGHEWTMVEQVPEEYYASFE